MSLSLHLSLSLALSLLSLTLSLSLSLLCATAGQWRLCKSSGRTGHLLLLCCIRFVFYFSFCAQGIQHKTKHKTFRFVLYSLTSTTGRYSSDIPKYMLVFSTNAHLRTKCSVAQRWCSITRNQLEPLSAAARRYIGMTRVHSDTTIAVTKAPKIHANSLVPQLHMLNVRRHVRVP